MRRSKRPLGSITKQAGSFDVAVSLQKRLEASPMRQREFIAGLGSVAALAAGCAGAGQPRAAGRGAGSRALQSSGSTRSCFLRDVLPKYYSEPHRNRLLM
jgi:hypothetical protein